MPSNRPFLGSNIVLTFTFPGEPDEVHRWRVDSREELERVRQQIDPLHRAYSDSHPPASDCRSYLVVKADPPPDFYLEF